MLVCKDSIYLFIFGTVAGNYKFQHGQVRKGLDRGLSPHAWVAPQRKPASKMTNESFEDAPEHKPVSTDERPERCCCVQHILASLDLS